MSTVQPFNYSAVPTTCVTPTQHPVRASEPRLKTFPRGLGKGSDTGLIGAWLEAVLDSVTEDSIPVRCLLC